MLPLHDTTDSRRGSLRSYSFSAEIHERQHTRLARRSHGWRRRRRGWRRLRRGLDNHSWGRRRAQRHLNRGDPTCLERDLALERGDLLTGETQSVGAALQS